MSNQYLKTRQFTKKLEQFIGQQDAKPKKTFKGLLAPQDKKPKEDIKQSSDYMKKIAGYMADIRTKRMELLNGK
jgi:hypothetical protein